MRRVVLAGTQAAFWLLSVLCLTLHENPHTRRKSGSVRSALAVNLQGCLMGVRASGRRANAT